MAKIEDVKEMFDALRQWAWAELNDDNEELNNARKSRDAILVRFDPPRSIPATIYYGATPIKVEHALVPTAYYFARLATWTRGDSVGYGETEEGAISQLLYKLRTHKR